MLNVTRKRWRRRGGERKSCFGGIGGKPPCCRRAGFKLWHSEGSLSEALLGVKKIAGCTGHTCDSCFQWYLPSVSELSFASSSVPTQVHRSVNCHASDEGGSRAGKLISLLELPQDPCCCKKKLAPAAPWEERRKAQQLPPAQSL